MSGRIAMFFIFLDWRHSLKQLCMLYQMIKTKQNPNVVQWCLFSEFINRIGGVESSAPFRQFCNMSPTELLWLQNYHYLLLVLCHQHPSLNCLRTTTSCPWYSITHISYSTDNIKHYGYCLTITSSLLNSQSILPHNCCRLGTATSIPLNWQLPLSDQDPLVTYHRQHTVVIHNNLLNYIYPSGPSCEHLIYLDCSMSADTSQPVSGQDITLTTTSTVAGILATLVKRQLPPGSGYQHLSYRHSSCSISTSYPFSGLNNILTITSAITKICVTLDRRQPPTRTLLPSPYLQVLFIEYRHLMTCKSAI